MSEANVLRYDAIPMDDFLQVLTLHEQNAARGALPQPNALRAALLSGEVAEESGGVYTLELYSCAEHNPLTGDTEAFVVLRAPAAQARALEKLAPKLRTELASKGIKSLFRIDPRYGLVSGSAAAPVDPAARTGSDFCYATLYLTEDPGHPALALLDYVDKNHRPRFESIFKKFNSVAPKGAPVFNFSLSRLLGKKTAPAVSPAPVSPIRYPRLRTLLITLGNQFYARNLKISLIFGSVTEEEIGKCVLDKHRSAYQANGTPVFFSSLDELLG